jgi:hypothetical protein
MALPGEVRSGSAGMMKMDDAGPERMPEQQIEVIARAGFEDMGSASSYVEND